MAASVMMKIMNFSVSGQKVKAIDTNGAGDMFARIAVLNGLNNQKNLEESSKFGCFAVASRIVSKKWAEMMSKEYEELKETFTSN